MKKAKVFALFLSLMLICSFVPVNIHAEEATDVAEVVLEDRTGVLTVYAGVKQSGSSEMTALQLGSGFLVGSLENGQYLITNEHVVNIDEVKNAYAKETGINAKSLKSVYQVIVAAGDVPVEAEVIKVSEKNDVAILKLKEKIYNSQHLVLSSKSNVRETQSVYALGYPYAFTQYGEDFTKQKNESVTIEKGSVKKFATKYGIKSIVHSAQLSGGSSGGPLLDVNGNVLGVNYGDYEDEGKHYYYAVQIDIVREILDTMGIQYDSVDGQKAAEEATEEAPEEMVTEATTEAKPEVDKGRLQAAIDDAMEKNANDYTEESWGILTQKLDAANAVNDNGEAVQADVDDAKTELEAALSALEEKSSLSIVLVIGVAAVVLIIIIVIVVMTMKKKKTTDRDTYTPSVDKPVNSGIPAGGGSRSSAMGTQPGDSPSAGDGYDASSSRSFYGDGAGETSVLNEGAGETTILSNQSSVQATLFRKSNFENIRINKSIFSIGKERRKVDYCISDNNSISRNHAEIVVKGGVFYLVDQKSTNGTYLNDVKLNPLQEAELKNGDKVRLSDEEFVFKMN